MFFKKEKIKITDDEYKQIIKELTERLKDYIFIRANKSVREGISKDVIESLDFKNDELEINFKFSIIINDLWQILGQIRRR